MKKQIKTAPQLANALRTAVNKKIESTGYSIARVDDDDTVTITAIKHGTAECGQISISETDNGFACEIGDYESPSINVDCHRAFHNKGSYDRWDDDAPYCYPDYNKKAEFDKLVNEMADFIRTMPSAERRAA